MYILHISHHTFISLHTFLRSTLLFNVYIYCLPLFQNAGFVHLANLWRSLLTGNRLNSQATTIYSKCSSLSPFLFTGFLITIQLHNTIAIGHGCLPPPCLQNQRLLGIDRIEQIFRATSECRLMELFLFNFRQTGYTLEQKFLGTSAFGTADPANLEVILGTNFIGACPFLLV
jgi:hypothetical protein